jgi:hypothetical protein
LFLARLIFDPEDVILSSETSLYIQTTRLYEQKMATFVTTFVITLDPAREVSLIVSEQQSHPRQAVQGTL